MLRGGGNKRIVSEVVLHAHNGGSEERWQVVPYLKGEVPDFALAEAGWLSGLGNATRC